jgi:hypothetical protein
VSTLDPDCYTSYRSKEEVVDYFAAAVSLYTQRPTYQWLLDAGIEPSTSKSYTRDQIQSALSSRHGRPVTLGCKGGKLDEVWYHFEVRGSVQTGVFEAADPDARTAASVTLPRLPKEVVPHQHPPTLALTFPSLLDLHSVAEVILLPRLAAEQRVALSPVGRGTTLEVVRGSMLPKRRTGSVWRAPRANVQLLTAYSAVLLALKRLQSSKAKMSHSPSMLTRCPTASTRSISTSTRKAMARS